MKLSIIIPVYNEEKTILELIKKVEDVKLPIEKEIILIDDCSTDNTKNILKTIKKHKIIFHEMNLGKGGAVKTGMRNASGDIFIIQDADLEYNPEEYPELIKPIIENQTKVVYGSRLKKQNKKGKLMFFLGGILITKITNFIYHSKLTDEPTCYKVFHKDLLPLLTSAQGNGFIWEPEITAKILMKKYSIHEVPISYNPRSKKEGKKINFKDGILTIITLFKWKFKNIN